VPRKAALRDRACEPAADGSGRPVGDLALPQRVAGAQLCNHHHDAEQAVRGDSQPDASDLKALSAAGLARRGTRRRAAAQSAARAAPDRRDDVLAGERAGRQRAEQ